MATFVYRPEVLAFLEAMGIRPKPSTAPEVVRELVNDLYRLELKRLRAEIRARELEQGRQLRGEYSEVVTALRESYPALAEPARRWVSEVIP